MATWCYSHQRLEEDTDYIDFPCSPTFLGAFNELGLTQRKPSEAPRILSLNSEYEDDPIEKMERTIRNQGRVIRDLQRQIEERKAGISTSKNPAQRDIDV